MSKTPVHTHEAPAAIGPYSQAVRVPAGEFVFCSGQVAMDPATGELVGGDSIQAQTEAVLKNLQAVLQAAGAQTSDVVRTTVYLTDMADFVAMNGVYERFFDGVPPARAAVAVAGLPKGAKVEISAIAVKS